ncbi:hypothetical protein PR003_g26648 [Phytophthora rubi]|uniref:Uncharacterized protein n=1 Tax=Phytophthora rubi TaxID=129364 RepID=A0A6A4CA64_9STRA|nr:hypothetical protein PR003_g26648 [Phytophthora rubi]
MYQDSQPAISPNKTQFSNMSAAIEQFRVRHRQRCRVQQQQHKELNAKSLEVEEGRTRKIPANWRQKQEQAKSRYGCEDGNWPKAAGTEMYIGFNAFDFSSCPEALYDMEELEDNQPAPFRDNQQLNYMPTSTSTSLWGLLTLRQSSGPSPFDLQVRSVPEQYANYDERRRAVCYKLQ